MINTDNILQIQLTSLRDIRSLIMREGFNSIRFLFHTMYSPELMSRAKEFWYVFDKRYTSAEPDVIQLYLDCYLYKQNPVTNRPIPNFDWMFLLLRDKIKVDSINYEQLFLIEVSRYENGIKRLARDQAEIINAHLRDYNQIQEALELFGQGVLYDERRRNVHTMQGRFPLDMVGYRRWYGFTKAAVSIGEDYDFWLNLDRSLLLAYLIQSELKPLDTRPDNPFINEERLCEYRSSCMSLESKSLDEAFIYYFPQ
jgi:hypothetical protein